MGVGLSLQSPSSYLVQEATAACLNSKGGAKSADMRRKYEVHI